jgi:hypothetical protein
MKEKLSDYGINGDDNSKEYSNPKTAVEYLWDMLSKGEFINDPEELFKQAKAMEKKQIMKACRDGWMMARHSHFNDPQEHEYYKETFKSE